MIPVQKRTVRARKMWDHRVGRACAELSAAHAPSEMPAPASEDLTRDGGSAEENRASVEGRGKT